ncbi:MAG: gamma-glutamyltransferase [Proteobacteria bacterium]|nr:gamma-glutamyltransferase [Pseudomonadota bacterium]
MITLQDLLKYRAVWREPLRSSWRDQTLLSSPPPSSGGFALLQFLGMKDARAVDFEGVAHNSPQYVHLVAEIAKRVYADRAEYAGDPAFAEVPIARLAGGGGGPGPPPPRAGAGARAPGGAVVPARFLLNNEMDDFSAKAGVPNVYGLLGGDANAIQPGKRMLSSMSPTMLLDRDGRVSMVVGSMGGSTIITGVFQVLVDFVDFRMTGRPAAAGLYGGTACMAARRRAAHRSHSGRLGCRVRPARPRRGAPLLNREP